MASRIVRRPARTTLTEPQPGSWSVQRPPVLGEQDGALAGLLMLVPMLGAGASMTVMMVFRGQALAAVGAIMMILTIIASTVLVLSQGGRAARQRRRTRNRYLEYLEEQRDELLDDEERITATARAAQPHPRTLTSLVRLPDRLWERRRDDADFLAVRLGTGRRQVRAISRQGEDNPLAAADDFMTAELDSVEARFASASDLPKVVTLDGVGHVSVIGDRAFRLHVARVILSQASALSSPEDLALALAAPPARIDDWRWASWLPHLADQERPTDVGPVRRVAPSAQALSELLAADVHARTQRAAELRRNLVSARTSSRFARLVVVVDGPDPDLDALGPQDREITPSDIAMTVVHLVGDRLEEHSDTRTRITQIDGDRFRVEVIERSGEAPTIDEGVLDDLSTSHAEALARQLAGLRLSPESLEHDPARAALATTELMGVTDLEHVDFTASWRPRGRSAFLRVPIGVDDQGEPVMLDLKEAAQYGVGPHGLCVGATGSGKSELLRTLVLGLLMTHSPDDVAMVLVDYKGGATFAPFAGAPQVSGIITNLSDDSSLVERVYTSLAGEVQRRQQLLKDAGNLADITTYRRVRSEGDNASRMAPMPHLLVIIDEFGELLTARPDFIELFLSIGRIGRSIGVHLLLSSQRIEGGKLRGLDTYLSYRIGMRTLSEAESRTVLETPDAFSLPPIPGYAYLKVDTTTYTRFRAGYVSGPLPAPEATHEAVPAAVPVPVYGALPDDDTAPAGPLLDPDATGPTVLGTLVDQLEAQSRTTDPVWLPPLPDTLTLDAATGPAAPTTAGLRVPHHLPLRLPLGLVDDPARQFQDTWCLPLDAAGGNVLVLGGPRSGKTTLLQTIALSAAVTHDPSLLTVLAVDLLGAGLAAVRDLPVVGVAAIRSDRETVRRTVEEALAMAADREAHLHAHGVSDLGELRDIASSDDSLRDLDLSEVLLLVDGWGQIDEEFPELETPLGSLLRRGPAYGIHIVATATRAGEVRLRQQAFFGTHLELRLSDPGESAVGRQKAATITADRPGRLLLPDGLFAQAALPRLDGRADRTTLTSGLHDAVTAASLAAPTRARGIRLLPAVVTPEMLDAQRRPDLVPIGLFESDLTTAALDIGGTDRGLVIIGDPETGRTNLLRTLVRHLVATNTPEQLVVAVFDPRRRLVDAVPDAYLGGYAPNTVLAERLAASIASELARRVPGADEPGDTSMRIVLVVDDYDVLSAGQGSPMAPLLPFLAMSYELNLTTFVVRRTAGASRGIYDPFVTALRESSATGVLLSGDRSEGPLFGSTRPSPLPVGRALVIRSGAAPVTVQLAIPASEAPAPPEHTGRHRGA